MATCDDSDQLLFLDFPQSPPGRSDLSERVSVQHINASSRCRGGALLLRQGTSGPDHPLPIGCPHSLARSHSPQSWIVAAPGDRTRITEHKTHLLNSQGTLVHTGENECTNRPQMGQFRQRCTHTSTLPQSALPVNVLTPSTGHLDLWQQKSSVRSDYSPRQPHLPRSFRAALPSKTSLSVTIESRRLWSMSRS